jgi:FRG domain
MAAWKELKADTLDDLYTILNRLSDTQAYVFRGQASVEWTDLVPSLHRMLGSDAKLADSVLTEASAIRAFRRHARSLLAPSELAYFDRILDSITLMQHYGAPTRLLDWTLSPWVSCYFAVQSEEDQDAAIWAFNQDELLKANHEHRRSRGFAHFRELASSTTVEDWAMAASHAGPYVEVFRYQYANAQMGAQQSLFTISGMLGDNHNIALERSLPDAWQRLKIRISKSYKRQLRQRLFTMNVSALALFPTPDGVGRNIRETIQCALPLGDEGLLWLLEERTRARRKRVKK